MRAATNLIILLTLTFALAPAKAQDVRLTLRGHVRGDNGQPIELASVVLNNSLGSITAADGSFAISNLPQGNYQWRVSCVGYEGASGTIRVVNGSEHLNVRLKELSLGLQQVTVTAKQSQMGSISQIGQEAIRHLQPKSVGDLLQLVPGNLTENPNLNDLSQANIREIGTNNSNAMGTQVVVDGTPLSNDANMELLSFTRSGVSSGSSISEHTTAGRGVDLRTIAASNVESLEVIRGIPGVEYGNLTSGVVIVNTKSGYTPWEAKLQADPNSKLVSLGKGFRLRSGGAVNFSADWAQSWADTRLHYKGYDRLTATAGYSHQFGPVSFNVRGAFYTSINDAKRDPQMSESYAEWESKNMGGRLAINGRYKPDSGFLTSLDYKVSGQLSRQYDWNKNWIFNPDGVITNTRRNGLQEGWFKRVGYNSEYEIESVPLNIYGQLVANKYVRLGEHAFTSAKVGLEYTYDGNRGQGLTYDEANPPQAQSSQRLRPRANKDIPALQTLSAFVGDRSSFAMGTMKAQFEAGVRLSNLFLNSAKSGGNKGFFVAEPRANININVLNSDNNRILDELSVNGGFGLSNKMPPLLYLYPDASYYDHVALGRWSDTESNRLALITTTVVNATQNPDLKPARSRKWEIGLTLRKGQAQASITYFNERHTNELGSLSQMLWINYPYFDLPEGATTPTFDAANGTVDYTLNGNRATATPTYYTARETWNMPANPIRSLKQGIEYTIDLGEWHALRTRLNITGAWFHIKRQRMETSLSNGTYDNRIQHISPYAVLLPEGSGSIQSRVNSNFAFITHIPVLKMVVTTSLQVVWRESSQTIYEDADGNSRYYQKSYADKDYMVVDPVGYYDLQGQFSPWTPADADNAQLNIYMARTQTYDLQPEVVRPWVMLNLRFTKELGRTGEISFTANNLTNTRQYRKNPNSNALYTVYPSMYFGAELKLRF